MSGQEPFPGMSLPKVTPAHHREANSEAWRVQRRADNPPPARSVSDVRNDVLHHMGTWQDGEIMGDPAMIALLDQYDAALRRAWENGERGYVRQQAHEAVDAALEAIAARRLV